MITFSKFGKHGRLGNQLFQYAAMIGMSKKYKKELVLPPWVYSKYFKGEFPTGIVQNNVSKVSEAAFHYQNDRYDHIIPHEANCDMIGYFQSEKYWEHCKDDVKEALCFNRDFDWNVFRKDFEQFIPKNIKTNIAISIRRGDYIDNHNYELLPITYYFLALQEHFPEWKNCNLMIFSDDPEYCKIHFGCLENAYIIPNKFDNMSISKYFEENTYAIFQLAMMSSCDHFIIANSTFSWWGAYLGEKEDTKIIRPANYFKGEMKEKNNIKDHYPERWIAFDHTDKKIDLSDVTFTIPVSYDHKDRKQNMGLNVCMMQRDLNTNIIVGEHGSDFFNYFSSWTTYVRFQDEEFHRTKFLNEMARMATTPIIANWDADVFISPIQIWKSVQDIRDGADMVFPYDGRFARVKRETWFKPLEKRFDVGVFGDTIFKGMNPEDKQSVGGAILFNRERFIEGGGENENFIAYGPEDVERDTRFRKIGYNVLRTKGVLYHMDHFKGPNSKCHGNKYDKQNHDELIVIETSTKDQLINYINTWPWKK